MTMMVFRRISSIVMLIFLFLGTVVPLCVSQVATPCPAEPSRPTTPYEFQLIDGTTNNVCATSNINPPVLGWIFRPASSDARGNFRVTTTDGPTLSFCVYENNGRPELVVTVPSGPTTGSFDVVFTSLSVVRITLSVRYVPRGFYREVLETELRMPSSESLWRAFGVSDLDSKVCRRVGNNGLEEVSFLSPDTQVIDPTTCLHPETNLNLNPSLISLLITGNVPRELIGETLSIFLVTGSCQMPDIQSEPIAIRVLNEAVSPSPSPSPSPSLSPSTSPSQLATTSPSLEPSPTMSPTDSLPEQDGLPIIGITLGVILSALFVLAVIILLVIFLVLRTRILSWCRRSWHRQSQHNIENPPPRKPNYYHTTPGLVEPAYGGESVELTLNTSEPESIADSGEHQETDSGVGSGLPGTPKKSITVLTEVWNEWYQELAITLAKLHQLQLTDVTGIFQPGQDVDFNVHSLALTNFEWLYVVWEGSLESKRSQPADPFKLPLLNIVDCLGSRSNEKEKLVFVQLGSSSRTLSGHSIKTICLKDTANTTSGRKCAQKIFTDVQELLAEGTDDGRMASKSVSALPDRITAETHQQSTSSWPGNRRSQPQCAATMLEGGSDDRLVGMFNQLSTALEQIAHNTAPIKDIARSANRLEESSSQIADNTRRTADSARETADNTGQMATNSRQIADGVIQVEHKIGQMGEKTHVIRSLVEETHHLAEETNDTVQDQVLQQDHPPSTMS